MGYITFNDTYDILSYHERCRFSGLFRFNIVRIAWLVWTVRLPYMSLILSQDKTSTTENIIPVDCHTRIFTFIGDHQFLTHQLVKMWPWIKPISWISLLTCLHESCDGTWCLMQSIEMSSAERERGEWDTESNCEDPFFFVLALYLVRKQIIYILLLRSVYELTECYFGVYFPRCYAKNTYIVQYPCQYIIVYVSDKTL